MKVNWHGPEGRFPDPEDPSWGEQFPGVDDEWYEILGPDYVNIYFGQEEVVPDEVIRYMEANKIAELEFGEPAGGSYLTGLWGYVTTDDGEFPFIWLGYGDPLASAFPQVYVKPEHAEVVRLFFAKFLNADPQWEVTIYDGKDYDN